MAAMTKSMRILVVDDNHHTADTFALLVKQEGHAAFVAYDGLGALNAAIHTRPHIVFLDISLPLINGYEVARQIRANPALKDALIVAVTAYGTTQDKIRAHAAGIDLHMTKPIDSHQILQTVTRALEAIRPSH